MKGRQRRSASHVADRGCVDADAAEALAGTNVIEAADLTQNAVNDVVDTLADTTVFPTVFTDRTPAAQFKQFIAQRGKRTCGSGLRTEGPGEHIKVHE